MYEVDEIKSCQNPFSYPQRLKPTKKDYLWIVLAAFWFFMAVGFSILNYEYKQKIKNLDFLIEAYQEQLQHIITPRELQAQVGAEQDGKMCQGWNAPEHSKTLTLWYEKLGHQSALRWFDPNSYDPNKMMKYIH